MFENAQLQNKLENLENVFIGSAIPRGGASRGGRGGKQPNGATQNIEGLTQDYTTSNLMIENNDLKKRIFNLEQEKIDLSQNLQ